MQKVQKSLRPQWILVLILLIQSGLLVYGGNFGRDTTKASRMYTEAMEKMVEGKYIEAKPIFAEASQLFRKKKYWERAIGCNIQITNAWSASEDREGLIEFFAETLELSKAKLGEEHLMTGNCYKRLGELYYLEDKNELARKHLDEALSVYAAISIQPSMEIADVYCNYGRIKLAISEYDSVEFYLDKALDIQLNLVDSLDNRMGKTYDIYGTFYYQIGKIDQAIRYKELVLQIDQKEYGEFHRETANSYNNLGASYERKGDYQAALDLHQKALDIRKSTLDSLHPYIALSLNNLANAYSRLGDYETSNQYHFEALRLRKEIFDEDHKDIAMSYTNLGTNYFYTDQPEKASYYFKKVVPIMENLYGPKHMRTADAYANAGLPFYLTGRLDSAFHYLYKALAIREGVQDGKNIKVARSYNNIGAICKENRDYELALSYYFKSLELYQELLGENSFPTSSAYNNIGEVYYLTDDLEKAMEYYQKSIEIEIEHLGPDNPRLASSYMNLGSVVAELGKYEESFEYNKIALQLQIEAYGEKNWLVPSVYANMAWDYDELDSLDRALDYMEKAINLREEVSGTNDPDLAEDYTRYGMFLAKDGQREKGLEFLHKGLAVNYFGELSLDATQDIDPAKLKDGNLFIETLATITSFNEKYRTFNDRDELLASNLAIYELIADLSISLRQSFRFEKSRLYALQQWDYLYSEGFETAAKLYEITGDEIYFTKAFRFAGLKKATALTDAILASQAMKNSGVPEDIIQREEKLNSQLENLRQSLLEVEGDPGNTAESEHIKSQINSTVIELNSLFLRVEKEYPEYISLRSRYPDYSPEEIAERLDSQSLLLDFVVSDSAIHAIVIGNKGRWIERMEVPANFEERTRDLLRAVKKYQVQKYLSLSYELYLSMIYPLEKYFEGIDRIITIPESYLLLLPLDVLICSDAGNGLDDLSDLNFFIKRFETVSHYSTDLWVRSKQRSATGMNKSGNNSFLGIAPVFDTLTNKSHVLTLDSDSLIYTERAVVDRMSLKGLPYSRHEVVELEAMFAEKGAKTEALLQEDATEVNFREKSGSFRYIHIATHGLINPEKPELSGLVFWKDTSDQKKDDPQLLIAENRDDGVLYTKEMYNLQLNADLVTLSACETGAGKLVVGEGLLSFVRGFTFAGVPNLVISYWKVNDKTTANFMFDFYGEVLSGDSYSSALRKAKLAAISDPSTAFPATWGTFVLIGY